MLLEYCVSLCSSDPRRLSARRGVSSEQQSADWLAELVFTEKMTAVVHVDVTTSRRLDSSLTMLTWCTTWPARWRHGCRLHTVALRSAVIKPHFQSAGAFTKLNFQHGRRGCCFAPDCCHVPAVPVVVLWGAAVDSTLNPRQPPYCKYLLWIIKI